MKTIDVIALPSHQRVEDVRNIAEVIDVLTRFARGVFISEFRDAELHPDSTVGFERQGCALLVLNGMIPDSARRFCLEYIRWKVDEHASLATYMGSPSYAASIGSRPNDSTYGRGVADRQPDVEDDTILRA